MMASTCLGSERKMPTKSESDKTMNPEPRTFDEWADDRLRTVWNHTRGVTVFDDARSVARAAWDAAIRSRDEEVRSWSLLRRLALWCRWWWWFLTGPSWWSLR